MPLRKLPNKNKTQRAERDSIPWRYCFLTLACGLILVVGFFFAARQHFSSIDFGIKNSKLRKQIEELESSKRRLILAKEIALSPAEIKKAARKIGLREMTASNIEVYRPNAGSTEKPAEKSKIEKTVKEEVKQAASVKSEEIKKEDKKPEKEIQAEKKPPVDKDKASKEKKDKAKTQIAGK
ncbi:MAG: hypothetical protein M3R14_17405 [Acidobacteriota bacterium]|nr:hypothetical protein [Acidobacteriota bacterium]